MKKCKGKVILLYLSLVAVYLLSVFCVLFLACSSLSELDIPEIVGYGIFFSPLLFSLALDLYLQKKKELRPSVTVSAAFFSVVIYFLIYFISPGEGIWYSGDGYTLILIALIALTLRSLTGIIIALRQKKAGAILLSLLIFTGSMLMSITGFSSEFDINELILSFYGGTPDRTGSWAHINQDVKRDEHWRQIVADSPFALGESRTETQDNYTRKLCDKGSYPKIDGSTVCVPMAVEFARQHLKLEDAEANFFVQFTTTHHAYENLIHKEDIGEIYIGGAFDTFIKMGSTDLVIATEPSDSELAMAESFGVTLKKEPVCYDAFVFITHKDNPVESLTVEEIKKIYTGEIKSWKEVGGKNEKIRAFQRDKNSGSQTAMENLVMGGSKMIDPIEVKTIVGMGELVDVVAEYENESASIGYTYRYYIDNLYKNDSIKTLAVNGVPPTDENIRSGKYPFTTNYYGVIRQGEEKGAGGKFLSWMLSQQGQECISQAGYISLN